MSKKGNIIIQHDNKIVLHLGDESHILGELMMNTLVISRNPEKHLMRQWDAYGINAQVLEREDIEQVVVIEGDNTYSISKKALLAHGRYHKAEEQEPQYFIARSLLNKI
jgi:hypothetical protein